MTRRPPRWPWYYSALAGVILPPLIVLTIALDLAARRRKRDPRLAVSRHHKGNIL